MTNQATTEPCPICDSQNTEIRFDRERNFKYLRNNLVLSGLEHTICLDCGCSFNASGQIERNNQRFFEFEKNALNGIIAPRKIVELRQTYDLTQDQAKKIFKTTGNLFSKWERGESAPSSAVSNLLEAALDDPIIMERFAHRAGIQLTTKQPHNTKQDDQTSSPRADATFPSQVSDHEVTDDQAGVKLAAKQPHNTKPSDKLLSPWAEAAFAEAAFQRLVSEINDRYHYEPHPKLWSLCPNLKPWSLTIDTEPTSAVGFKWIVDTNKNKNNEFESFFESLLEQSTTVDWIVPRP